MSNQLILEKFSIGVGDRFGHQASAQLRSCILAEQAGIEVVPVWNKSNREHEIIGSKPDSVRKAADEAVQALHWEGSYYCDADHITLPTVEPFLGPCDFFTIDVADFIGHAIDRSSIEAFVKRHSELAGRIRFDGLGVACEITPAVLEQTARKFLFAIKEAGKVYRKIESGKGKGNFISEISMDETDVAQSPAELLIILAAIHDEGIPIQTIAPKFSGRFNKGVDYQGDVAGFTRELALDVAAIKHAVEHYGLPENLKLSVHSGSDKFSIYPAIFHATQTYDVGVHLKTAGTTWLEEMIGLAEAGGEALALAQEIYAEAYSQRDQLCVPYATVIDIDPSRLPSPAEVNRWSSEQFVAALRHQTSCPAYNPDFRQLLHVGFKVAARLGARYLDLLQANEETIARNVTENLFTRHIAPVFLGRKLES